MKFRNGRAGPKRETRRGIAEVRAVEVDGAPGVTLHCIRPGVVDDYGSLWMADTFDESLAERMPTLCWSHDWNEPLGPPTGFDTGPDGPEVSFRFSDFDAVPMARRAHAQLLDGTIQDCSVGFSHAERRDPTDAERRQYPGIREVIYKATLDEVSLVMRGAVPGAKVLAVRSVGAEAEVDEEAWLAVARKVAAGDLTVAEGKAALALAAEEPAPATEPETPGHETPKPEETPPGPDPETPAPTPGQPDPDAALAAVTADRDDFAL